MTARQLCEAAGIEESILSKVRSGSRNLKVAALSKIAQALGVSPLALLRDDSLLAKLPLAARSEEANLQATRSSGSLRVPNFRRFLTAAICLPVASTIAVLRQFQRKTAG